LDNDREFARGWRIITASMFGMMFSQLTLHTATLAVLTPELVKVFGWTRSQVQAVAVILVFSAMFSAPVAGVLVNRYGPRRVLQISMPLLSLTFMAFALNRGSLLQFYATGAISACLGSGTLPMAYAKVVTTWFPKRTGSALAVATIGPALISAISIPAIMWLLDKVGWRGVYVWVGLTPMVVYPLVLAWLKEQPGMDHLAESATFTVGETLPEALRQWRTWVMGFAFAAVAVAVGGCLANLPTLLADAGLQRGQIMLVAPALGGCAIIGRLAGGGMLDRWWAPGVTLVFLILLAGGLTVLGRGALSPLLAAAALGLIGFSSGVENDLLAYMVSRYFGMRAYASVYGTLQLASGVGGGFSPFLFSLARDLTGSFRIALFGACGVIAISAVGLLSLGRYRYFTRA
jgi:predicted MFS family arabinose efflux permease